MKREAAFKCFACDSAMVARNTRRTGVIVRRERVCTNPSCGRIVETEEREVQGTVRQQAKNIIRSVAI